MGLLLKAREGKKIVTRTGESVTILAQSIATDDEYPVKGIVWDVSCGTHHSWTKDGKVHADGSVCDYDLIVED